MTKAQILKKIRKEFEDITTGRLLGHDENKKTVLWWDPDNQLYCVSSYEVLPSGELEWEPMPSLGIPRV